MSLLTFRVSISALILSRILKQALFSFLYLDVFIAGAIVGELHLRAPGFEHINGKRIS
jgi:hypothetical protein